MMAGPWYGGRPLGYGRPLWMVAGSLDDGRLLVWWQALETRQALQAKKAGPQPLAGSLRHGRPLLGVLFLGKPQGG